MKSIIKIIMFCIIASIVLPACKKSFDSLSVNENKPVNVPSSLLLNGIENSMYEAPYTMKERWGQYYCCDYDYYGNNRYDFGAGDDYYATLENVVKMDEEATAVGLPDGNVYNALFYFFKAYLFSKMSLEMGDVPMADALRGTAELTPTYTPQKQVFQQAFLWLDSANTKLTALIAAQDNTLKGDIYFDNNISEWQKTINAYRLRLLIELSKQSGDADLNIKSQFASIINDPTKYPLMQSAADNLQYTFLYPTNEYPMNPGNFGFDALRYNTSATYVGLLTQLKDPRVYVTTEPATALVKGKDSTDFNVFVGANPGEDLGTMYQKTNSGQYSLINRHRFYETYTGEPSIQIGYAEMCFNIAEAINRGWISEGPAGNAETYYLTGIKASMAFYGIPESGSFTAYFLKSGSPGSSAIYSTENVAVDFNNIYYKQSSVKYAGNNATGLTQILQQKYLALFRHSGLEAYYQNRRTGVPTFTTGAGTGNSGRIPLRFQYPSNEKTANATNYKSALQLQYGGNDDINGTMWLLK
ncbi:MAG: SusD/RagB family nutrient-binding outer membrane lipoprotein [Parafilimonas sp.]